MPTWYQASIRYQQTDEQGKVKAISEVYLFDAVSYTDAEAKTYAYVADNLQDFQISTIKRMKLAEVFFVEEGAETWYKCKVQYITFDEKAQKEKKVPYMMLINAENPREAYDLLKERLGTVSDYLITDCNLTTILEVVPYDEIQAKLASGRLIPLSEAVSAE